MSRPDPTGRSHATTIALLALPFAVFYWAAPLLSQHTLGADYGRYAVPQQLLLQFSLASGSFPLYLPRFAGGQSASAATQGQLHHPISHLAAHIPGYWNGGALEIYTLLSLLSLGLALWALHRLLRELGLDGPLAFVGAFATVFNLRMLSLFVYGSPLQSYVGYLLLCVAVTRLFLHGPGYGRIVCVAVATYLLLCSGHPQMAYLGFAGALLVVLCVGPVLRAIVAGPVPARGTLATSAATTVGALALGMLLSAAYLAPFAFDFLPSAAERTGNDFSWVYTPFGTRSVVSLLHSLLRPFSSDVLGSFGGPAILLVPLLAPVVALRRRPSPGVALTWLLSLLVLALALAETLPLYYLAWKYLPLFSSFRAPGRVTIMVPFLLLLLFAWMCRSSPLVLRTGARTRTIPPLALGALVAALLYAAYGLLSFPYFDALELIPPARIHEIPTAAVRGVYVLGIASLVLLAAYAARPGRVVAVLLMLAVVSQGTLVLRFGTWVTSKQPTVTWDEMVRRHRLGVGRSQEDSGSGMAPAILVERRRALGAHARQRPVRLYWDVRPAQSRDQAFAMLRRGDASIVTLEDPGGGVRSALAPPPDLPAGEPPIGSVSLEHASYNRFSFAVHASHPGLLVVAQPYSGGWQAQVRGSPAPIGVANAAFIGIAVPAGDSTVDLRYDSAAARVGMLVSLATAWLLAAVGALRLRRPATRVAALLLATAAAVLAFSAWERSLHTGRHLGTWYQWRTPPATATPTTGDDAAGSPTS